MRCDRGVPQCVACVKSGVACVVRSTSAPRGPKKGHLRTLQKQIGEASFTVLLRETGRQVGALILESETPDELQNRLREQAGDLSTSAQAHGESPSGQPLVSDTENEDENSDGYPDISVPPMGACAKFVAELDDMSYWPPPAEDVVIDSLDSSFMFAGWAADSCPDLTRYHALLPESRHTPEPSMHRARAGSSSESHFQAMFVPKAHPSFLVCEDL